MENKIINGKIVSDQLKDEISQKVATLYKTHKIKPQLCVIIVGENPASKVYVRNKKLACEKTGMLSKVIELPETIEEKTLIEIIENQNQDPQVHGILVQLPLPKHIDEEKIINIINPSKDVDCFHPYNVGKLTIGDPTFIPCTPGGIIELFKYYQIQTAGKNVTIVGRSNIVGKPMALLLLQKGIFADATVTICHSRTKDIKNYTQNAHILIAAIGRAEYITGDMIRKDSVIIDVGINRVEDSNSPKGYSLKGDVKFEEAIQKAAMITPVPRGVGPMTIAVLLQNTYKAAINTIKK